MKVEQNGRFSAPENGKTEYLTSNGRGNTMYFKHLKDARKYAEKHLKGKHYVYRYNNDMKMYYISSL